MIQPFKAGHSGPSGSPQYIRLKVKYEGDNPAPAPLNTKLFFRKADIGPDDIRISTSMNPEKNKDRWIVEWQSEPVAVKDLKNDCYEIEVENDKAILVTVASR